MGAEDFGSPGQVRMPYYTIQSYQPIQTTLESADLKMNQHLFWHSVRGVRGCCTDCIVIQVAAKGPGVDVNQDVTESLQSNTHECRKGDFQFLHCI